MLTCLAATTNIFLVKKNNQSVGPNSRHRYCLPSVLVQAPNGMLLEKKRKGVSTRNTRNRSRDLSIYRRVAIGLPIWTHITWINRNFDKPLTSIRFTVDLQKSSMGMDGLSIIFIKGSRLSKPLTLKNTVYRFEFCRPVHFPRYFQENQYEISKT